MSPRTRILLVVGFALALGFLRYARLTELGFLGGEVAAVAAWALAIVAGFAIRRLWALLVVLGPLLALALLEVSGYETHAYLEWADRPLASPPGIGSLFLDCLAVLIGISLGLGADWLASFRQRRMLR